MIYPYATYIPYIGPYNALLGVKCQGRVVTCFTCTSRTPKMPYATLNSK